MMNFRVIKASIINNVLGPAEAGRYRTIGYQKQTTDVEDVLDNDRSVQLFYSSSDFPKKGSGLQGPFKHEISYRLELAVSKEAVVDLAVLNNPVSTPAERAAVLNALQEAGDLADESFDELVDIIYQVFMDADNLELGLDIGVAADRWIGQVRKDEPEPTGELVLLTGTMVLTCAASEEAAGDPGVSGAKIIDTVIDIDGDDIEKTGALVTTNE